MWIAFHQVIAAGDYSIMLGPVMALMLGFIPGLLAAGLLMAVFEDTKILGNLYALFALIMGIVIAFLKFDPTGALGDAAAIDPAVALLPSIMVMVLHIPSALIIVVLPLITTIKKQTRWPALLMTVGGILFGVVGLLLSLVVTDFFEPYAPIDLRYVVMGLFSIFLLLASICFAFGTLIPAKWNFDIPGIEFEERA